MGAFSCSASAASDAGGASFAFPIAAGYRIQLETVFLFLYSGPTVCINRRQYTNCTVSVCIDPENTLTESHARVAHCALVRKTAFDPVQIGAASRSLRAGRGGRVARNPVRARARPISSKSRQQHRQARRSARRGEALEQ